MSQQWRDELLDEFHWGTDEPGPEKVIEEAKGHGIESVDKLMGVMKEAPSNCDTGYTRWKWHREYRCAFGL